jgi:hypothetical protein
VVKNRIATITLASGASAGAPGMMVRITNNNSLNGTYQMLTSEPLRVFTISTAAPDGLYQGGTAQIFRFMESSPLGHSRINSTDQASRGQSVKSWLERAIVLQYPNGSYPFVGYRWWEWRDNYMECSNWGLVNLNDDLYNGSPGQAVRTDAQGYETGGWPLGGYTDFISHFKNANRVWLRYAKP